MAGDQGLTRRVIADETPFAANTCSREGTERLFAVQNSPVRRHKLPVRRQKLPVTLPVNSPLVRPGDKKYSPGKARYGAGCRPPLRFKSG